jgi:hypothetical protein
MWHVKEPAVSAKFAALAVAGNGDSRQIAEKLLVRLKTNKQTNKHISPSRQTTDLSDRGVIPRYIPR